jgi:NAD(P)-dependent dehydrogenase (short-subunit alcohol dehydrogenase family)
VSRIGYDSYAFDYTGDDFTFNLCMLVDGTMYTDMCNTYFVTNLDVMVNNAGINMRGKDTHTVDKAFFDWLININLKSVYHRITACAPMYVVRWIVLIFSELYDFLGC